MRDECIALPENITELKRVTHCYDAVGLPGACGSMDVVHIKWSACPTSDLNEQRERRATQLSHSNASLISIGAFLVFMGRSSAPSTISIS